jgi:hypothetical protein
MIVMASVEEVSDEIRLRPSEHNNHEEAVLEQQQQRPEGEEQNDDDTVINVNVDVNDDIMDDDDDDDVDDMDALIENQQWDKVVTLLQASPEQASRVVNPSLGWTKLHWLCSIGSAAPTSLIDMVARLYPQAIGMPDNRYGDTPLHIICRNSVINAVKLRILLSHLVVATNDENGKNTIDETTSPLAQPLPTPTPPSPHCSIPGQNQGQNPNQGQPGLLIRNRFGATALHSACNHNAVLGVIEALVQADARIVRVTTHDGVHAISALYSGYVQTIPGTMAVSRILQRGSEGRCVILDDDAPHALPPPNVPDPPTDTTSATTTNATTSAAGGGGAVHVEESNDTAMTNAAEAPATQQPEQSQAAHFERFWKKVEYLATAVYLQTKNNDCSESSSRAPTTPPTRTLVENTEESAAENDNHNDIEKGHHDPEQYNSRFVLHGLLQSHGVSLQFYQLALKYNPAYAQVVDEETGNLPLHVLLERRPFRLYERQAIQATLQAYPTAAARRNHGLNHGDNNDNDSDTNTGDLPLLIAVRNKIPWHNGLDLIAQASPASSAIAGRDAVTGLWPFQLAASVGGRVAVETTFELLKNQPDLLSV